MQKLWLIFVLLLYISPLTLFGWGNARLSSDQVFDQDVLKTADKVIVESMIKGDLLTAGATVRNQGHISGDMLAFGNYIQQSGRIEGDGRLIGTEMFLDGIIEKNLAAAGFQLTLDQAGQIKGNLDAIANSISLKGKVGGNVVVRGNAVTLAGEFGKNVEVYANSLTILPKAKFSGTITYFGAAAPTVSPAAAFTAPLTQRPPVSPVSSGRRMLLSLAGLLIFTAVAVSLLPQHVSALARRLTFRPARNFLSGLLFLLMAPPLTLGLFMIKPANYTAVGLLGAYLSLCLGAALLAQAVGGAALGRVLWETGAKRFKLPAWGPKLTLMVQALSGCILLGLVAQVPYLGITVLLLLTISSAGSMLSLLFAAGREKTPAPAVSQGLGGR